jgi:hypothetical protein
LESFRRSLEPHFNRLLSDAEIAEYQPSAERRLLRRLVEESHFNRYYESFLVHYGSLDETYNDGPYPGVHEPAQAQEAFRAAAALLGVTEYFTHPSMVAARIEKGSPLAGRLSLWRDA